MIGDEMNSLQYHLQEGVSIAEHAAQREADILSPRAVQFIVNLERAFGDRRRSLLKKRQLRQHDFTIGKMPVFSSDSEQIRSSYWKVSPVPYPLLDRRVECIGPPQRQFLVDSMNSAANVVVADFEDTFSPTWDNVLNGHSNIHDAVHGSLMYADDSAQPHAIVQNTVNLMVRPRGLHAEEKHIIVDGKSVSASIFDFALFVFHNTQELRNQGKGPYFYIPKIESHAEAKFWNDVIMMTEDELQLPRGTVKATVSIETLTAAFEMHEILYELREHCVGMQYNWKNFVFSFMKITRHMSEYYIPDPTRLSVSTNFIHSLSILAIQTGHKRGVPVIAGPASEHPSSGDGATHDAMMIKIRVDKSFEAEEGFDGSWVLDPAVVPAAKRAFDEFISGQNQLHRKRDDANITETDLLTVRRNDLQPQGLHQFVRPVLEYFAAWLGGSGILVKNDTVITAAEAEIMRMVVWNWKHTSKAGRSEGQTMSAETIKRTSGEVLRSLLSVETRKDLITRYITAKTIFDALALDLEFPEFFTVATYQHLE